MIIHCIASYEHILGLKTLKKKKNREHGAVSLNLGFFITFYIHSNLIHTD